MKVSSIVNRRGYEYDANLRCEFCGFEEFYKEASDSSQFHTRTLPFLTCRRCHHSTVSMQTAVAAHTGRGRNLPK